MYNYLILMLTALFLDAMPAPWGYIIMAIFTIPVFVLAIWALVRSYKRRKKEDQTHHHT